MPANTFIATALEVYNLGAIPVHHAFAPMGLKKGSFPVAEMLADKILSLPIFPEITNEQIDSVVDGIKEFYE